MDGRVNTQLLHLGLIGCGKQAPKHIGGLKSYPEPVRVTVNDVCPEFAEAVGKSFGVEVELSAKHLLADPSVDGVIIATPTPTHFPLISAALAQGKHVFCEKPLCANRQEGLALQTKVAESGKIMQVGYVYRVVPAFAEIHDILHRPDPPLGQPVSAIFRIGGRGSAAVWKHRKVTGGGAVNEMLVHMADLAQWFLGPLGDVRLHEHKLLRSSRTIAGETVDVDAEDLVIASARSASGAEVLLQADMLTPSFRQYVEIQGENGSIMGSIQSEIPSFIHLIQAKGGFPAGQTNLSGQQAPLFEVQMHDYLDNIRRGSLGSAPGVDDSLRMFSFLEALV
jgi:myo-inositol 2-dehydrogenase/D-chiro-inositol 1-dehydrogenase